MRYAIVLLTAGVLYVPFFKAEKNMTARMVGGAVLVLGVLCFFLYFADITGVGISAQIVKWFERIGLSV